MEEWEGAFRKYRWLKTAGTGWDEESVMEARRGLSVLTLHVCGDRASYGRVRSLPDIRFHSDL